MNTEITPETGSDVAPAIASAKDKKPAGPDARGLLQTLQEVSPTFREVRPLALRIDKAIAERFPDVDRKVIRSAMRIHTATTKYLKSVEKATARFDLDGKESGEVTEEQRSHASQTLKERFAEVAKRKRAAAEAERERQREEESERRKADKLAQLVGKFSKR